MSRTSRQHIQSASLASRHAVVLSIVLALSLLSVPAAMAGSGAPDSDQKTDETASTDAAGESDATERFHPLGKDDWDPLADEVEHAPNANMDTDDGVAGGRRRRRVYRRRVYRTYRRPHYHHHHHHSNVVVVTGASSRSSRTRIVARPRRDARMSAGLRFTAVSVGDTELSDETFGGTVLGGIGGYIRGKAFKWIGVEFAVDVMGNLEKEYDMLAIPVMAGLMVHILPESPIDIYGIAGGGIVFTSIDYAPVQLGDTTRTYTERYTQIAGQLGAGLEFDIGALELTTDLRWLFMQSRPDRDEAIVTSQGVKMVTQERDAITHGIQFMVGVGGNFF